MMHHPHYDVNSACKLFLGIHTTTLLYNVGTFNEQHHLISSTLCITNALVSIAQHTRVGNVQGEITGSMNKLFMHIFKLLLLCVA